MLPLRQASPHAHFAIALDMDADEGQVVRYADGNPLNMRRNNLRLVHSAKGKSRARSFVYAKNFIEVS